MCYLLNRKSENVSFLLMFWTALLSGQLKAVLATQVQNCIVIGRYPCLFFTKSNLIASTKQGEV